MPFYWVGWPDAAALMCLQLGKKLLTLAAGQDAQLCLIAFLTMKHRLHLMVRTCSAVAALGVKWVRGDADLPSLRAEVGCRDELVGEGGAAHEVALVQYHTQPVHLRPPPPPPPRLRP